MRPYLRNGSPVGQRSERQPITLVLCTCSVCTANQQVAFDSQIGRIVPGQMVGYNMYLSHQRHSGILPSTYEDEMTIDPLVCSSKKNSSESEKALHRIEDVLLNCKQRARDLKTASELIFISPPNPNPALQSPPPPNPNANSSINQGHRALDFNQPVNREYLRHELWLTEALEQLDEITERGSKVRSARKQAIDVIHSELARLEDFKESEWKRQENLQSRVRRVVAEGKTEIVDTTRYLTPLSLFGNPVMFLFRLIATILLLMCRVSISHCGLVLTATRSLLAVVSSAAGAGNTNTLISALGLDVNGALDSLDLRPVYREFTCCPKCFACYPVTARPDNCSSRSSPSEPECGQRLYKSTDRHRRGRAAKRYLHHDMKHWIGRMLCRPGMEDLLDRDVYDTGASSEEMSDIWDGRVLKEFKGVDGRLFVQPKNKSEGRYVFSLNMDGFNPFGNKIAGKKVSCGAIYMVCLNLPPHLRFRPENILLVGVTPGPEHPCLTQTNHFLRILVDELLVFWNRGVYFSRTFSHTKGRLVRCALVPVVCDLPAARQVMGFAGHTATNFCCYCGLHVQDINNVDIPKWPPGPTRSEYLARAAEWRDASLRKQDTLFDSYGIRWSELLRLPYWDPTRFVVLDCMHLCYLGMYRRHCRHLWGMAVDLADGDGAQMKQPPPDEETMARAWDIVRGGTYEQLANLALPVLKTICNQINTPISSGATKALCAGAIQQYRQRAGYLKPDGTPVNPWVKPPLPIGPVTHEEALKTAGILWKSATITEVNTRGVRKSALEVVASSWTTYLRENHVSAAHGMEGDDVEDDNDEDDDNDRREASGSAEGHSVEVVDADKSFLYEESFADIPKNKLIGSMLSLRSDLHSALGDHVTAPLERQKRAGVLGRATLQEIWTDIEATILPSWVGRPASGVGKKARGKLKADEWRTFCNVSLVHTLPRLWRGGSTPLKNRYKALLDNFMDLVIATKLASSRILTKRTISRHTHHIKEYLTGVRRLFPHIDISPNQHLSAHLATMLLDFGPTHAWRCFPFERYNYMLQQINTSGKFGEMEATMFERFCMTQNLRSLMQTTLPQELNEIQHSFLSLFENDYRGSLLYDVWAPDTFDLPVYRNTSELKPLEDVTWTTLQARLDTMFAGRPVRQRVLFQKSVTLRGQTFAVRQDEGRRGYGNSNILWGQLTTSNWKAGRIRSIFVWRTPTQESIFAVVDELQSLSSAETKKDPYRKFDSSVAGKLFRSKTYSASRLLTLNEIKCHFAELPYTSPTLKDDYVHVIPLERT